MRVSRHIALIVAAMLMLTIALGGCTPAQLTEPTAAPTVFTPPSSSAATAAPAAATTAAPAPQPVIADVETVMFPYFGAENNVFTQDELDYRIKTVNALLLDHGVQAKIDMKLLGSSRLTMVERREVDAFLVTSADYVADAIAGYIIDISAELETRPELWAINPEMVWRSAAVGDEICGIPLQRDNPEEACASHSGMFIRTDILDDLDLKIPTSVDELIAASEAAKAKGLPYTIAYLRNRPPYALHRLYDEWPFYVDGNSLLIYDGDGNVELYADSEIYRRDAAILSELFSRGILEVFTDLTELQKRMVGKWNFLAAFTAYAPQGELANKFTVLQFMPEKANYSFNNSYSRLWSLSQFCDNPQLTLDVLECIYTNQDVYDAFVYGEKGVEWQEEPDGSYKMLTRSAFCNMVAQTYRGRKNAEDAYIADFYLVDPASLVYLPARLFTADASAETLLMRHDAYKGENGYITLRFMGGEPSAVEKAVSTLRRDGIDKYLEKAREGYAAFFE